MDYKIVEVVLHMKKKALRKVCVILLLVSLLISMFTVFPITTVGASSITVFAQTDGRWGSHQYGYSNTAGTEPATISSGGCGILAMVNAVYYLNGSFIEPITLADYSVQYGYRINGVGTSLGLYKSFANNRGNTYNIEYVGSTTSYSTLASHLQAGCVAIGSAPGHLMAVVDYNSNTGEFLILDSYRSSNRLTYPDWYTWQTSSTCQNTYKLNFSSFEILRSSSVPDLEVDASYSKFMPLTAYLSTSSTVYPCERNCSSRTGGEIWVTDKCTINEVYTNGWCQVTYPGSGGDKTAYTECSNFMPSKNLSFAQKTAPIRMGAYSRSDLSSNIGTIDAGDSCFLVGVSGNATQAIYPTSYGYKLGWSLSSNWNFIEPDVDERFNPYCPIHSYPLSSNRINVYNNDFSTWDGISYIDGATDNCTLNKVYKNGWCEVTYPTASGSKTKYTQLSNFVNDTSTTPVVYTANTRIITYIHSDLSSNIGWVDTNDTFFKVCESGNATQVLYPVDDTYGGGYRLAWIRTSELPVNTFTVTFNANGGTDAPSNQTKKYNEALTLSEKTPKRTGYSFVGWATEANSFDVKYASGAKYTNNADVTLFAVWALAKCNVLFDFNGGEGNIQSMVTEYNNTTRIPNDSPSKIFHIYWNSGSENDEELSSVVECSFLGWSLSKTSTSPDYKPGDQIRVTDDVILYAVWNNPVVGQLNSPTKEGYRFLGWFSSVSGGNNITSSTTIYDDTVFYAHWEQVSEQTDPIEPIDPASPKFVVSQVKAHADSTVAVDVFIENNPAITSFKLTVNYPSNVLTLTGVEYKDLFSSRATGTNRFESPFTISWFSSGSVDETANGVLATLTFTVAQNAAEDIYPITLTYDPDDVFDSNFDNKEFTVVNGEIIVSNSIPGDVNGDRKINMKDIVLLQQYLNGWNVTIDMLVANVNGDTKVNMKDIVLLQQYLNGWDVELK